MWRSGSGKPPTPLQLRRCAEKVKNTPHPSTMDLGLDAWLPNYKDLLAKEFGEKQPKPKPLPDHDSGFRNLCEITLHQYNAGRLLPTDINILEIPRRCDSNPFRRR